MSRQQWRTQPDVDDRTVPRPRTATLRAAARRGTRQLRAAGGRGQPGARARTRDRTCRAADLRTGGRAMSKPTAVLFCPGRGSYTKDELGFVGRTVQSGPVTDALAASDRT